MGLVYTMAETNKGHIQKLKFFLTINNENDFFSKRTVIHAKPIRILDPTHLRNVHL
jgi:hypothetical protein